MSFWSYGEFFVVVKFGRPTSNKSIRCVYIKFPDFEEKYTELEIKPSKILTHASIRLKHILSQLIGMGRTIPSSSDRLTLEQIRENYINDEEGDPALIIPIKCQKTMKEAVYESERRSNVISLW